MTMEPRSIQGELDLAGTSQTSFEELWGAGGAVVEGRTLMDKAELIGVPFIITRAVFRPAGMAIRNEAKVARDYVSVEIVTRNSIDAVFNDGSTGVRRQLVLFLMANGVFTEAEADDEITPERIANPDVAEIEEGSEGEKYVVVNMAPPRHLKCPRGLRVSHYENEFGEADTYYLG